MCIRDSDIPVCMAAPPQKHREKLQPKGNVSAEYFACVHTPVHNWRKIPKATEAVDKEWKKLEDKGAWKYETVQEYHMIAKKLAKAGVKAHFGHLMRLCHVKHSELECKFHIFKGRVVFRGDIIKDECGDQAVFSEQGTSASHLALSLIHISEPTRPY